MSESNRTFGMIASDLRSAIDAALPALKGADDAGTERPIAPGKWTPKQILGHLIDSAANNHQRFVRAQEGPALSLPGYAQEHWVAVQGYRDAGWDDLVRLWHAYNDHLVRVIGRIPDDCRDIPCTIGLNAAVTLGYLAHDYVVHLKHHLGQLAVVAPAATGEETLAGLQQVLVQAWLGGDRATIERVIAPEWTLTAPDGTISTRQQVLDEVFVSKVHVIESLQTDDVRVRMAGESAVVSGRTHGTGSYAGTTYDVRIRFTDVFVRRQGRWQAIASHAGLLIS